MSLAAYPDRIGRLAGAALGGYAALLCAYVILMVEWCQQWGFADPDRGVLMLFGAVAGIFLILIPALKKRHIRWRLMGSMSI